LSLVILARRIYQKEGLVEKLLIGRLTSPKAPGGTPNRAVGQSSLTQASRMVRHLRADGPVLKQTVRLTQPDSPPMARGVGLHTKRKRRRRSKAHITQMVSWSKPALLLINCSPNTLADSAGQSTHGQRRRPPHKAKKKTQEQSTYNANGQLVKASTTFDQLLSKYASKKVVHMH
jgi:predicted amidohydrolase YtcJ